MTMLDVRPPETLHMRARDGARLASDIYRPATQGDFPVLLMRQPYGRRIASTVCYAHPSWYSAHGYIVIVQDVRGRGGSEGAFALFENEAADGADAVAWAAALPGSTGAVGMYGFSYQGDTQLLAAAQRPPALKAIAPAMIGWDLRNDWAYENDAFCLAANLSWAIQLGAEEAKRAGDFEAFHALHAASRATPVDARVSTLPAVMERYRRYAPHYFDWLEKTADDPYWARISPAASAQALTAGPPALFIGGWYDTHLPGTVSGYRAYEEARGAEARLVIGPWAHFPWGRRLGDMDFGDAAIGAIDQLQVRWFDHWLKGEGEPPMHGAPVRLFDMGARAWRDFAHWPQGSQSWRLTSSGRAALDERDGVLQPADGSASDRLAQDRLVHDPWRPAPSRGGAFAAPAGPVARIDLDARPDVLTFTTPPLAAPLTLAGAPRAELHISADAPSMDLSCILSRVDAEGRAMHLTEGYRCFTETPNGVATIPLRAACVTLQAGERLRLSIAAASFPNHPVNPGDGSRPTHAALEVARVITITLTHAASRLDLPIAEFAP
ncbi:MAG: CocE/NonD family hydrolase [Hyphomonadaceae bacterium]|nr:CocE/NonD family hydrolase [Hyphomonadaceae bacterium]